MLKQTVKQLTKVLPPSRLSAIFKQKNSINQPNKSVTAVTQTFCTAVTPSSLPASKNDNFERF